MFIPDDTVAASGYHLNAFKSSFWYTLMAGYIFSFPFSTEIFTSSSSSKTNYCKTNIKLTVILPHSSVRSGQYLGMKCRNPHCWYET
jgi:hypothetical protein